LLGSFKKFFRFISKLSISEPDSVFALPRLKITKISMSFFCVAAHQWLLGNENFAVAGTVPNSKLFGRVV